MAILAFPLMPIRIHPGWFSRGLEHRGMSGDAPHLALSSLKVLTVIGRYGLVFQKPIRTHNAVYSRE